MARIWITPEGKFHSTTREDTHLTMATTLVKSHGLKPGRDAYEDVDTLFAHGFLRISDANVEGQLAAIQKHNDLLSDFLQRELTRRGKRHTSYFDFLNAKGRKEGTGSESLGEVSFWGPNDWSRARGLAIRRESENIFRLRRPVPDSVRVRPYQRRQGRTKPL
ncbi:MAG: hypothetical protein UY89_C0028G0004 [Parcubacteria group bacterium GW2011_GWA1_54_9]|nr:MAG: hypothetical protein UY89_C0028G0004 [Parcubacteria group bacterium GW2011_GWA1_54_9]